MSDSSSLGVTPAGSTTGSFQLGYNLIQSSTASAINIGSLTANTSSLSVLSSLSPQAPTDYYAFNFTSGDAIKLGFNNLVGTTGIRVQLLDSTGNIVADSDGTTAQQAAYTNLTSSNGLTANTGQYVVQVSYQDPTVAYNQAYNFQLYSGTTYDSSLTTTALTQPYDPNLFNTVASTISPASNLTVYNRSATLAYSPTAAAATSVGNLITNQTALNASGTVNAAVPSDEYSFATNQDGAIKLGFANTTNSSNLDVQVLDSSGNVIADNQGTDTQKFAYKEITSGAGLQVSKGQYLVKIGFTSGQLTSTPQSYNFQLYSGTSYSSFYSTATTAPTSATRDYQVGNNLTLYHSSDATTSSRQGYNTIDATAADAVNIGWLQENQSSLAVSSQLTNADNTDYYNFTFQKGSALKLDFSNLTNTSAMHIQLLDSTGLSVIADNQGTAAQKAAFANLTSDTGLTQKTGQYVVAVSYGANADRTVSVNYNLDLYSGTQYTAQYKTIASAQTLGNYLLSGGSFGYNSTGGVTSILSTLADTFI